MKWKTDIVISVASGRLCCNDIGDVYALLKYMTGEDIFTHQLPRACDTCLPYLVKQFPWLDKCRETINGENYKEWTDDKIKQYGDKLDVNPLPSGTFENIDPLKELLDMRKGKDVIVVAKESDK